MAKQGSLSINSENIFPIIKKWLYSDHDIFIRELVSNGCDAVTKLKKLSVMGEFEEADDEKYKVEVRINPTDKTLTFIDNGIGMTEDEVDEYINQIAFSGAAAFMEQYKDKASDEQIIGHFGLGFYSAFMVADKVTIDTLSYKEGATPVHWECDGGTEFDMEDGDKAERGTTITLYLNDESYEFCNEYRCREILNKYCSFMPVEIYFVNEEEEAKKAEEAAKKDAEEKVIDVDVKDADTEDGDSEVTLEDEEEEEDDAPKPINQIHPLWTKHPNDCTDEEYKEFYRDVFHDYKEPLFWIHLNMDYPFNLKGILYFPKINTKYDTIEGTIKLYNNQVFIADNIKEVIPEYLLLLKGCIDCPDLPLNVSRSALQNDGFVKKISNYITKKVAEKLSGMCKTDRENYEKYWDDISPFIKFGCLKDEKFCDKMNDYILFKNLDDKYLTLPEILKKEEVSEDASEDVSNDAADTSAENASETDTRKVVYYVTDKVQQSQYIRMFKEQGMDAVILDHNIDTSFISQLEARNEQYRFARIDADVTDSLKEDVSEEELKETTDTLTEVFKNALGKDNLDVKVEKLKDENISSMITLSEDTRRMQDMMKMYSMHGMGMDPSMFGGSETLVLNANNALVQYIFEHKDSEHVPTFCKQLYDLAMIANQPLPADEMAAFIARSNEIMMLLAK